MKNIRVAIETPDLASTIFSIVETVIAYFGALIIAYGGFVAIYKTLLMEFRHPPGLTFKIIRGGLASRIILGLDFLIASDILSTIGHPDLNEVLILGGIVLIRVVLTLILSQETKEMEEERKRMMPQA